MVGSALMGFSSISPEISLLVRKTNGNRKRTE